MKKYINKLLFSIILILAVASKLFANPDNGGITTMKKIYSEALSKKQMASSATSRKTPPPPPPPPPMPGKAPPPPPPMPGKAKSSNSTANAPVKKQEPKKDIMQELAVGSKLKPASERKLADKPVAQINLTDQIKTGIALRGAKDQKSIAAAPTTGNSTPPAKDLRDVLESALRSKFKEPSDYDDDDNKPWG